MPRNILPNQDQASHFIITGRGCLWFSVFHKLSAKVTVDSMADDMTWQSPFWNSSFRYILTHIAKAILLTETEPGRQRNRRTDTHNQKTESEHGPSVVNVQPIPSSYLPVRPHCNYSLGLNWLFLSLKIEKYLKSPDWYVLWQNIQVFVVRCLCKTIF